VLWWLKKKGGALPSRRNMLRSNARKGLAQDHVSPRRNVTSRALSSTYKGKDPFNLLICPVPTCRENFMMVQNGPPPTGQLLLADKIRDYGMAAFNPAIPEEERRVAGEVFMNLTERYFDIKRYLKIITDISISIGVAELMPVLNLLIQPGRTELWLRSPLMVLLTTLPGRPHGVLATIEFILSVHPSTANSVSVDNPGRSTISHEAMQHISKVLCSLPLGWTAERWFDLIGEQP